MNGKSQRVKGVSLGIYKVAMNGASSLRLLGEESNTKV
jgi:hypothetical protein